MSLFLYVRKQGLAQIINSEYSRHTGMEPIEKLSELDRAFDLLLVILGIITSALFQFQSTRLPLEIAALNPSIGQEGLFHEVEKQITIWLRIFLFL